MASNGVERTIPLSQTVKFIVDNRGKTAPTARSGIALIATNCVTNDHLYPLRVKLRFVSQETYETWFRAHPQPGDILLTNKGSQNGAICLVPNPVDFVIAQDMVAIRPDEKVIDPLYLFAALRSPGVQQQIKNLDVSGVIPHFKKTDFDKLLLPYPDRHMQQKIGRIYFGICSKIELNRRVNVTLEAIARVIFRSNFLESLPHAGATTKVGEVAEIIKGRSYKSEELVETAETALVTLKSFERGGGYKADGLKGFAGPFKSEQQVRPGEVVIALTDVTQNAEVIGKPALVRESARFSKLIASLDTAIVRPRNSLGSQFLYCLFRTQEFSDHTYAHCTGTTVLHLDKEAIASFVFPRPEERDASQFEKLVTPMFGRIAHNELEDTNLTELRDTLLPKLMSGELRLKQAEKLVEAHA